MAQFYRRMGSRVTVLEEGPQITAREDEDIAQALQLFLESEENAFRLNARVTKVAKENGALTLTVKQKNPLFPLDRLAHLHRDRPKTKHG